MVIFKRKTLPKINNKHGVVASAQQKGWMDADQTNIWIEKVKVWHSRLGGLGRRRGLLVYDVFEAHVTESVKAAIAREALLGGGAHVPRLNFTATYVAISEHSRVACRNFINKCFTSFAPLTIHIRWNDANGTYGLYL